MLKLERQLFIENELHEKGSVLVSEAQQGTGLLRRDNTPGYQGNGSGRKAQQNSWWCLSAG